MVDGWMVAREGGERLCQTSIAHILSSARSTDGKAQKRTKDKNENLN